MIIGGNKYVTQADDGAFNILAGSFILELLTEKKIAVLLFLLVSEESNLSQPRLREYFFLFFLFEKFGGLY